MYHRDIRCLTGITNAQRVYLYNGARLFLYPSFFEGFGFPPLEAQACGIPVIAANRTSLPEILSNQSAFLIDPWRVSECVSAIREIETSAATRSQLSTAGRANVESFSWIKTAQQTRAVFTKINQSNY